LFGADTGQPRDDSLLQQQKSITTAKFAPDGGLLLTLDTEGKVRLWNALTGQPVSKRPENLHYEMTDPRLNPGETHDVAFCPRANLISTVSLESAVQLWNLTDRVPLGSASQYEGRADFVELSPDGTTLFVGTRAGFVARLMKYGPSRPERAGETGRLWGVSRHLPRLVWARRDKASIAGLALSSDARTIFSWDEHNVLQLRNSVTGEVAASLEHDGPVVAIVDKSDEKVVVTVSGSKPRPAGFPGEGNKVYRIDAVTGKLLSKCPLTGADTHIVAITPDGTTVLTIDKGGARVWDAVNGSALRSIALPEKQYVFVAAFSPDGKAILLVAREDTGVSYAMGTRGTTVWLLDAATGKPRMNAPLKFQHGVSAAVSPDGQVILTGGDDGEARLWSAASGQPLAIPRLKHPGLVTVVAFSPNGKTVITGTQDGTVRLWDVPTGKALGMPLRQHDSVDFLAVCPNGNQFLTASRHPRLNGQPPWLWAIPDSIPNEPERVRAWVETLTGFRPGDQGVLVPLSGDEWRHSRQRLDDLGGPFYGIGRLRQPGND
jgi:WD40 repeat protein